MHSSEESFAAREVPDRHKGNTQFASPLNYTKSWVEGRISLGRSNKLEKKQTIECCSEANSVLAVDRGSSMYCSGSFFWLGLWVRFAKPLSSEADRLQKRERKKKTKARQKDRKTIGRVKI